MKRKKQVYTYIKNKNVRGKWPVLASLTRWLSVRLWTKWLWVRLPLLSPKPPKFDMNFKPPTYLDHMEDTCYV